MYFALHMLLAISVASFDEKVTSPWRCIKFANSISIPTAMSPKVTKEYEGCSIVRVVEVDREIEHYIETRKENKLVSRIPSRVKLKYRIEEVYAGDAALKSRTAHGIAWEYSSKSRYLQSTYSEWIPETGDEGIWLVKKINGKLTSISLDLSGVRFPIYASGVHQKAAYSKHCEYKQGLEFAKEIHKVADPSTELSKYYWSQLAQSSNELIARWATLELWKRYGDDSTIELREICRNTHSFPMVQAMADRILLASSDSKRWRYATDRQSMVSSWLDLNGRSLEEILAKYLVSVFAKWDEIGYEKDTVYNQMKNAILSKKPGSKEWHVLIRVSEKHMPPISKMLKKAEETR